jgi:hypothetical protein
VVTEYIVKLTYIDGGAAGKAQRDADKVRKALGPLEQIGGGAGRGAATNMRRIADEWQRLAGQAERSAARQAAAAERASSRQAVAVARSAQQEARARARAAAQAAREDERFSAYRIRLQRREVAERERAEKAMLAAEMRRIREAQRAEERAAKAQARAHEKSLHKSYYGGQKSFSALLGKRAEAKASHLATGVADGALGIFGSAASGAVNAASVLVSETAGAAYNLGRAAISAQAMRESSVEGFKAIYGSSEEANRLFDVARTAAKQTKFDTAEVVRDFNTIAAAGFSSRDIERIYWTSADIGSARGNGKQQSYLQALAKLNASPQAMFGNVQQAGLAGPGVGNVFQELSERLGYRQTLTRKEWQKKFRSGDISGQVAIEAVIAATNKLYNKHTGKPGEYAKGQGDTSWSGVLSNIKNGLGDVLNMRLGEDHPLNRFKILLQAIGSTGGLFDETSQRGQRFAKLVSRVVEDIFLPFGGVTLKNTGDIMDRILDAGEALERKFRSLMKEIAAGFDNFLKTARGSLINLGVDIGIAIGTGIVKASGTVLDRLWEKTGGAASGALYDLIAPKSQQQGDDEGGTPPVRATMALGGVVPGPYGSPQLIMAHGGEVVSGLHGEYAARMGGNGGGSVYNITLIQNITGSGDPVETGQRSAAANEMMLDRYFGRLAAQGV